MSQAGFYNDSPTPLPDIETLTGNSGGPVGPDGAGNIDVLGVDATINNVNGITTIGTPASNLLEVTLTNRLQGTASVTGAVTGDIITFDLGASAAVYRFTFVVSGRDTTSGDGVGYTVDASARTDGAAATTIATPFIDADEDASLSAALITVVASGNNVILRSTGVAGQTIDYSAVGYYVVV